MLSTLRMENLALVTSAQLRFGTGLTVLTGESGSGKSIVLDALALVTGSARPRIRARSGCPSGFVEAEFYPARTSDGQIVSPGLKQALDAAGLLEACADSEEPLILARRLDASGRTRSYIQGQTVSRTTLASVGRHLVELCGQSEAHNLRTPAAQLAALDHFAHLGSAQVEVARLVEQLRIQEQHVNEMERQAAEAERRRDFLEFQLAELRECDLTALGERKARLDALTQKTSGLSTYEEILTHLSEGDGAVLPQLKWLLARLSRSEGHGDTVSALDGIIDQLTSISLDASAALRESDRDQEEAEELSAEFSKLYALAQKHRIPWEELPERQQALETELEGARDLESKLELERLALEKLRTNAQNKAERLHNERRKAATKLDQSIKKELAQVGLGSAQFETHLVRGDLGPTGITHIDFGFSANPGHAPQPLSRVASGGELSRILLCFRLATEFTGALLTFDEIDAGAGGKTAEKIAASLKRASATSQVLCVTHWPQVAGSADHQFSVRKSIEGASAESHVTEVSGEARLVEISRMLGGAEQTARQHASQLVHGDSEAA